VPRVAPDCRRAKLGDGSVRCSNERDRRHTILQKPSRSGVLPRKVRFVTRLDRAQLPATAAGAVFSRQHARSSSSSSITVRRIHSLPGNPIIRAIKQKEFTMFIVTNWRPRAGRWGGVTTNWELAEPWMIKAGRQAVNRGAPDETVSTTSEPAIGANTISHFRGSKRKSLISILAKSSGIRLKICDAEMRVRGLYPAVLAARVRDSSASPFGLFLLR
jgi:hypothetical protein